MGQVSVKGSRVDRGRRVSLGVLLSASFGMVGLSASAETLESAMGRAYVGNPSLNAQRASTRATDENVPRSLSGYRSRVNATADVGAQYTESETPPRPRSRTVHSTTVTRTAPRGVGGGSAFAPTTRCYRLKTVIAEKHLHAKGLTCSSQI